MLKDITLGQYYPANSPIHRLDPRVKLFGTLIYIIALFLVNNIPSFILVTVALILMIIICRVPFKFMVKGLRAVVLLFVIAGILNLLFTPGEPIVSFGVINITRLGIKNTLLMLFRIIYLIIGASIMTLTTTPTMLTAGLERGLGFLKIFKVPVHELAMMMSIALRFIPILMEEADRIMKAQQARGADFSSGNIFKKAKSLIPILVPLFVSAFRRANDLALAMEARCYHGGEGRTKMNPLKYKGSDAAGYILIIAVFAGVIALRIIFRDNILDIIGAIPAKS